MNKNKGFTLIELMITVAIMSIMMAVGLPSFQSIIASSRLTAAANAMVSALQLARFEAIKQHKPVVVTKKTNWKDGWIVYVDKNRNNAQDTDEPTLATFDAISPTVKMDNTTVTYTTYMNYDESGRANVGGHFTFCSPATGTATDFRKVVIAATGRMRVETPTSCT
jgi:type IV fimbrial biogenesis protein FimT